MFLSVEYKRIYIYLFFIISLPLSAQFHLSGYVKLDNHTPAAGAFIQALQGKHKTITLAATDTVGYWELALKDTDDVRITIRYLGYLDTVFHTLSAFLDQSPVVVLQSAEYLLKQAQINGQKPMVLRHGDSSFYSMKWYRNKTSNKLSDALNKMPGIEVSGKQILYKGKKVDKLLLEGKDLLRDQHQLLLNNYHPSDIEEIQMIENYRPFMQQQSGEQTGKTALNVILTNDAKNGLKGEMEGGYGNAHAYRLRANFFRVSTSSGQTAYLMANNIGEPSLSPSEYFQYQYNDLETLLEFGAGKNLLKELSTGFFTPENVLKNRDKLAAYIDERQTSNHSSTRIDLLTSDLFREQNITNRRLYSGNTPPLAGTGTLRSTKHYVNLRLSHQSILNTKLRYKVKIPITIDDAPGRHTRTESIDRWVHRIDYSKSSTILSAVPTLFIGRRLDRSSEISAAGRLLFNSEQYIDDYRQKYKRPDSSAANYFLNRLEESYDAQLSLRYSKKHKKHWKSRMHLLFIKKQTQDRLLLEDQSPEMLRTGVSYSSHGASAEYKLQYRHRQWNCHLTAGLRRSGINSVVKDTSLLLPSYGLYAKYRFTPVKFLAVHFHKASDLPPADYFSGLLRRQDYNTLFNHNLKTLLPVKTLGMTIIYFRYHPLNHILTHLQASYNKSQNAVILVDSFDGVNFIRSPFVASNSQGYRLVGTNSYSFSENKYILKLNGMLLQKRSFFRSGQSVNITTAQASIQLASNLESPINAELIIGENYKAQEILQRKTAFYQTHLSLQLHMGSVEKFRGTIRTDLLLFGSGVPLSRQFRLDAEAEYRLSAHWKLTLRGTDVLHYRNRRVDGFVAYPDYIEFQSYETIAGRILLGVVWLL